MQCEIFSIINKNIILYFGINSRENKFHNKLNVTDIKATAENKLTLNFTRWELDSRRVLQENPKIIQDVGNVVSLFLSKQLTWFMPRVNYKPKMSFASEYRFSLTFNCMHQISLISYPWELNHSLSICNSVIYGNFIHCPTFK